MYHHRYQPPSHLANKTATAFASNKYSINSYPSSSSSSHSSQANNNSSHNIGSHKNNNNIYNNHSNSLKLGSHLNSGHNSNISHNQKLGGLSSTPLPIHLVEERQDVIFRRVRGILNKITPETFDKLSKELVNVGLDSPRTLRGVIYLLFDKALKDLKYSSLYAKLCQQLSDRAPNFETEPGPNTFCKFLISKCEDEFERRRKATEDFDGKNELTDEEYEQKAIVKQKMLGNIKFICELGKKRLLQEEILHECIRGLLSKKKERPIQDQAQNLECLCQIMRTIGSLLDIQASRNLMNQYFERIDMFSKQSKLPSRIRFMLRDIIDLRNNNWRPRPFQREENVPQPLSKLRAESGYDPSSGSSNDKHGNNKEFVGLGDLSKLHGNKLSMLLDDDGPGFTTSADLHWGPAFLHPLSDPFEAFSSSASQTKQSLSLNTKNVAKPAANTVQSNHASKQRNQIFFYNSDNQYTETGKLVDKPSSLKDGPRHGNENRRFNEHGIDKRLALETINAPLSQSRHDRDAPQFMNSRNRAPAPAPPQSTNTSAHHPRMQSRDNISQYQNNGSRRLNEPSNRSGTAFSHPSDPFEAFSSSATQTKQSLSLNTKNVAKPAANTVQSNHASKPRNPAFFGNSDTNNRPGPTMQRARDVSPHATRSQASGRNPTKMNNRSAPPTSMQVQQQSQDPLRSQNLSPLLKAPPKVRDANFSLRPSHNLVGRPIGNAEHPISPMRPNFTVANQNVRSGVLQGNVNSSDNLVALGLKARQQLLGGKNLDATKAPTLTHSSSLPQVRLGSDLQNGRDSKADASEQGGATDPIAKEMYINKFSSAFKECTGESDTVNFNRFISKLKELKIPKHHQRDCLVSAMKQSILGTEKDRDNVSKMLSQLTPAIFDNSALVEAFREIFDQLKALEVETPKVKSLVANLLSRAVFEGLMSLEEVGNTFEGGKHHPLFLLFLQRLEKNAGQAWLSERFTASKINLINMLPEVERSKDRLASVLKDRCLGFLDPMLTIEPDLWEQMKERDPSPNAVYRWIKENIDSTIQSTPTFAHLFVACLMKYIHSTASSRVKADGPDVKNQNEAENLDKSSPSISTQANNEIEKELLAEYQQVLQALLKDKNMQLAALHSLQSFYFKLDFPKGALLRWFHMLYEMNIVDDDVFFIWKEEINDKFPGKGQALFQVNTWLNWLAEAESEEEEDV